MRLSTNSLSLMGYLNMSPTSNIDWTYEYDSNHKFIVVKSMHYPEVSRVSVYLQL